MQVTGSRGTWLCTRGFFVRVEPTSRHFYRSLPSLVHLAARFFRDLRLEDHPIFPIDLFELFELFPYVGSKTCSNGRS